MSTQTNTPIRFAILGCGTIASTHAEAIQQIEKSSGGADATLAAVYDPNAERAASLAEKFRVPKIHGSEADLLADGEIDAVCLCTPSGLHMTAAV
ncbi:MAG: Gfo/Idh/MocA family oxidoreductase, partial [Fibrella sp.]|nr:Gfo/Idh/MocA family oxidoreductase [Armatimonadota bacterium]